MHVYLRESDISDVNCFEIVYFRSIKIFQLKLKTLKSVLNPYFPVRICVKKTSEY